MNRSCSSREDVMTSQQVVNKLAHLHARVRDGLQITLRFLRKLAVGGPVQHLHVAVDVPQRRAQVVGDGVGERFQFLVGLRELAGADVQVGVELSNSLFGLLTRGDVHHNPEHS